MNKPVLLATYLRNESVERGPHLPNFKLWRTVGQVFFAACFFVPVFGNFGKESTYIRLIVGWVAPVFFMLWSFAYQLLLGLPRSKILIPIMVPTVFLWIVDTLALHRGTWSIESGTKLGINLWPHLDLEEALFFFVTNAMISFGSCAFDTAIAILDAFPEYYPKVSGTPSPWTMLKVLFLPTSSYNAERMQGLRNALVVLSKKSRSFYLASGVFTGRLRIDLILLYGFCRVADDLIDDAPDIEEAQLWVRRFTTFLDAAYSEKHDKIQIEKALTPFPPDAQSILRLLPVDKLPSRPLYALLDGFKMDLKFLDEKAQSHPPIQTEQDLEQYATCVAAGIGELCLSLVYYHDPDETATSLAKKEKTVDAGIRMGRVLQYINIARDVTNDAEVGRCYIPAKWFKEPAAKSTEEFKDEVLQLRKRIVNMAFDEYAETRDAIEELPPYAKDGIRVAVESYMEIGRVLRHRIRNGLPLDFSGGGKKGKASVPKKRRIVVGWLAMSGWRGPV